MTSWDDRGNELERRPWSTSVKWGLGVIAAIVVLSVAYIPAHFALGWFSTAANVAGPGNVTEQFHAVIGDWNAMQAAAGNYCQAKDTPQGPNSPALVEDPAFAYAAQYRHITVDYNERQNNIFEAGVVGPNGYPKNAPSLDAMVKQVC
jgi:hypothetical protein